MANVSQEHLVKQIVLFLIDRAQKGTTTTYQELALEFGLPSVGNQMSSTIAPILGEILVWCHNKGLPPLTVLVVRKSGTYAGVPGKGFWVLYGKSQDEDLALLSLADAREFTRTLTDEVYAFFDMQ